jgi:mannitol-1-/sugar-/sorbitol-6-phosphatase
MPTFLCSAVLFDLDGVLADSTGSVDREWREWAHAHNVDAEKVLAIAHGVRSVEVIRAVAPHLDAAAEARKLEKHEATDQHGVEPMPGASELVNSIPTGRWGVVTSGSRRLATARLHFVGIPRPKVMVTADDVVNGKPHPEPYLKGAQLLGVNPGECVVIEDAPAGIQAAHAGGMKVIGLASTYPGPQLHAADAVVEKLKSVQVTLDGAGKLKIEIA